MFDKKITRATILVVGFCCMWTVMKYVKLESEVWWLQPRSFGETTKNENTVDLSSVYSLASKTEATQTNKTSEGESNTETTIIKIMDFMPLPWNAYSPKFDHCECTACETTQDVKEAKIFIINPGHQWALPPRKPGDIWVLNTWEPPFNGKNTILNSLNAINQFNWTRTILAESTFPLQYGTVVPVDGDPPKKDYHAIFRAKKYDVAWMVSHCNTHSKRAEYVQRMMSSVNVHIYGACGNYTCGSSKTKGAMGPCLEMVSRDYKFYLAFENSFCRDYITEKIFRMYFDVNTIPVVRGGANYSNFLPDGTYINAADFSSPEELGTFLHRLARDEKRFTEMLKRKFRFKKGPGHSFACELCCYAHSNPAPHWYNNIYEWYSPERNCRPPNDI